MKTKIKKYISYFLIVILLYTNNFIFVNAVFVNYNVADFTSNSFNNGISINTGNKAGVQLLKEATFSGTTQISDSSYNIADMLSTSFNNGLPVNTGKKAKVIIDKSIGVSSGQILASDVNYNIADMVSSSFNNGLPVNTGKKAKVIIDKNLFHSQSGTFIYGDTYYNIADMASNSFNNGLPVNTGKKAKVLVSKVVYESGVLIVNKTSNYNIADFTSNSFNNGLPVNTGKKAQVIFETNVVYYQDQNINTSKQTDSVVGEITYTDVKNDTIPGGFSKDYSNSLRYVFQAMYKTNKSINLKDVAGNQYNSVGNSNTVVIGDKGLLQLVISKNPANQEKLSYNTNNEFIITDGEIYKQESSILQVFLTGGIVVPPVLTYPYNEVVGSGITATGGYYLKTNYPTIKGMAYPKSTLEATIGTDKYYVKVNNDGLFEFNPSKKINDGLIEISFQYSMLENEKKLSSLTNKKLLTKKKYSVNVEGLKTYEFPYIMSIYNDDYIYGNIFYMQGFANPGDMNYKLTTLTGTLVKEGTTKVDGETKKFSFLLGDKTALLQTGQKYIIEVWQGSGFRERKSFMVLPNNGESIEIMNIKDFEILPTLKPVFIGMSRETTVNNDAIRVYACDITQEDGTFGPCLEENRLYLGNTSGDKNGWFNFTPLAPLSDHKYYEVEFVNTTNLKYAKKIIIKIETQALDTLFNSQVINIFNGLNVGNTFIQIHGFTLPYTHVTLNSETLISDEFGIFDKQMFIGNGSNLDITFSSGGQNYRKIYTILQSENAINNIHDNYYQYYNPSDVIIISRKNE